MTCLNLAHECSLRHVGAYCGVVPNKKDPHGSMMKIMKAYGHAIQGMDPLNKVAIRAVPDPSRTTIQHHLLRSRQLAGPSAYIFAIYNGHGIQEAPTSAGELWSFDVSFEECQVHGTQPSEYIPLLLFDILSWAGASSLFVWDVKNAGRLVEMAKQESAEIDRQLTVAAQSNPEVAIALPAVYSKNQIHFAACQPDQVLPKYPAGLPDDLFTACILEPLRIALLFHNLEIAPMGTLDAQASRSPVFMKSLWGVMSEKLKGRLSRELHAVLCTIAWKTLDSKTYAQLFAQGGVVSKASAGFILAQRVMGAYGVQPTSMPTIPSGLSHPLWTTWDLCLSTFFEQLPLQLVEDDNWQDDLELLSFLSDQLQSVITINQGEGQHQRSIAQEGALSRLPIILEAAHVGSLKQQACRALDACLNTLDANGLRHAIRCGVLQMAMNILSSEENGQEMDTQQQGDVVISIWASLIQNEEAIRHLSAPALKADYLSEAREISFFLQHLKSGLTTSDLTGASIGVKQTIQCAAILSTIISSLPPREAPALLQAMLELALQMLGHGMPLMQEWGCLLTGQLLKSLRVGDSSLIQALVLQAKEDLLGLIEDRRVETRAAALDALQCWFKRDTVGKGKEPELRLLKALLPRVTAEAAVQTRLQLTNLLCTALSANPVMSRVAVLTLRAQELVKDSPEVERQAVELSSSLSKAVDMDEDKFEKVTLLMRAVQALELYCEDSHTKVAERARGIMRRLACEYKPAEGDGDVDVDGNGAAIRGLAWVKSYAEETIRLQQQAPEASKQGQAEQACPPSQLFRSSKDLLRAYLANTTSQAEPQAKLLVSTADTPSKTTLIRHRLLEDAITVAEQQTGLPWKWHMGEFSHPEVWTSSTFHSFEPIVMSTNATNSLLLWDWSTSSKKGVLKVDLPPGAKLKSGRFINELSATAVVMAEDNQGKIHIITGEPHDPSRMRTISSFLALDLNANPVDVRSKEHQRIRTTWWRSSGLLGVGGSTGQINLWDCAAEQRLRVFNTQEDYALTSLITEPKSGNLLISAFDNSVVKIFDLRQPTKTACLKMMGDTAEGKHKAGALQGVKKLGVYLGESHHITSACGYVNILDLRMTKKPKSSVLAHPGGICKASFQSHSGLLGTIGWPEPAAASGAGTGTTIDFKLYRSQLDLLSTVTEDTIHFKAQGPDVVQEFKPYIVFHHLRPFAGINYGQHCHLRASGVGSGSTTDSGSYLFLSQQEQYKL